MDNPQAKALGELLRQRRVALGFTATEVARSAGVPPSTLTRLEQGNFAAPSPEKLTAFAKYLGLNLADVFAKAGYVVSSELPSFGVYLGAKYPDLPPSALRKLSYLFVTLAEESGITVEEPPSTEEPSDEPEKTPGRPGHDLPLRPRRSELEEKFGEDFR